MVNLLIHTREAYPGGKPPYIHPGYTLVVNLPVYTSPLLFVGGYASPLPVHHPFHCWSVLQPYVLYVLLGETSAQRGLFSSQRPVSLLGRKKPPLLTPVSLLGKKEALPWVLFPVLYPGEGPPVGVIPCFIPRRGPPNGGFLLFYTQERASQRWFIPCFIPRRGPPRTLRERESCWEESPPGYVPPSLLPVYASPPCPVGCVLASLCTSSQHERRVMAPLHAAG